MSQHIIIGHLGDAFGVQGWLHLLSYADPADNIFNYPQWQIQKKDGPLKPVVVELHKPHGKSFIVKLKNCNDRDQALSLKNHNILIDRATLPALKSNTFYWRDLIGLTVMNLQNQSLGKIDYLFETGANDVIVTLGEHVHYIPYIKDVVKSVDLENKIMRVDWE